MGHASHRRRSARAVDWHDASRADQAARRGRDSLYAARWAAGGSDDRLTLTHGLADNSILTLTETQDGTVLAGTTNGFSRIRGNEIDSFRPQDGLSQSTVYSLYEDREGSLWAATKHGLNQFLDGRAIPYTTSEGLPSNSTGPVLQHRRGRMWVGTLGR